MAKLLKAPVRGGLLTLTDRELVLGEGWLGTRNVRRFPLSTLLQLHILPSPRDPVAGRNMLLRFEWDDGQTAEIDGVGSLMAERIKNIIHALCNPRCQC